MPSRRARSPTQFTSPSLFRTARCSFLTAAGSRKNGCCTKADRLRRRAPPLRQVQHRQWRRRRGDEGRPHGTHRASGSFPQRGSRNRRPRGRQTGGCCRAEAPTTPQELEPTGNASCGREPDSRERRFRSFWPPPHHLGVQQPNRPIPSPHGAPPRQPPPRPRPAPRRRVAGPAPPPFTRGGPGRGGATLGRGVTA